MALPDIRFHFDDGSDSLASGAGPATAITGSNARNKVSGSATRVGFYEGTPPDLSGVATDGSHAVWLSTGAGRKWIRITGVDNTQQTTTGSINSGSPTLTVASSTGLAIGDTISVVGAGAAGATLYSIINNIVSTTVTLADNASTTVVSQTVTDPRQVTVDTAIALSSPVNWAIGGKRKDLTGATQLWADLTAGWIVTLEQPWSGSFYNLTAVATLTFGGNTTDGRVLIRGSYTTTRPTIKNANTSTDSFDVQAGLINFQDLQFDRCDEAIKFTNASATDCVVKDCTFNHAGDGITTNAILCSSTGRIFVMGCDFRTHTRGVQITGAATVAVEACYFATTTSGVNTNTNPTLIVRNCIFKQGTAGIDFTTSTTASLIIIEHCTFFGHTNGISVNHVARGSGFIWRNNVVLNCTTGANFAANTLTTVFADYNNYNGNGTSIFGVAAGAFDDSTDPKIRSDEASGTDFRTQSLGQNGLAWPRTIGVGSTQSYPDFGASQRREPLQGRAVLARVLQMEETTDVFNVTVRYAGGAADGLSAVVSVPKANLYSGTDPLEAVMQQAILNAYRSGFLSPITSFEIIA